MRAPTISTMPTAKCIAIKGATTSPSAIQDGPLIEIASAAANEWPPTLFVPSSQQPVHHPRRDAAKDGRYHHIGGADLVLGRTLLEIEVDARRWTRRYHCCVNCTELLLQIFDSGIVKEWMEAVFAESPKT